MTNCDWSRLVASAVDFIFLRLSLFTRPPSTASICPDQSSSTSPSILFSELPPKTRICQSRVPALSAQDLRPSPAPFSAPRKGGSSSRRHFSLRRNRAFTEARVITRFILIAMPFYTLLQAPLVSWVPPPPASAIPIPRHHATLMPSSPHPHAILRAYPLAFRHLHNPNHAPLPQAQPRRPACPHGRRARRPRRLPPLRNDNPRVTRPHLLRKRQRRQ